MEPIMHGIPQLIITFINFVATINLARYVGELESVAASQIEGGRARNRRIVANWRLLLAGWWCLCTAAIVGMLRMLVSLLGVENVANAVWVGFDLAIITLMAFGYGLVALNAGRAWSWNTWRGRPWE